MAFEDFQKFINAASDGVVIDIGTGDGQFVYRSAILNPNRFFIGIDPNSRPLEKISEKIHRNPAKGGAPNVLYLLASAEDLPSELNNVADEVSVHFPWGSLLKGLIQCNTHITAGIHRICKEGGKVRIVFSLNAESDRSEIERLGLPEVNDEYVESVMLPHFMHSGFEILEARRLDTIEFESLTSAWAKRLAQNRRRLAFTIQLRKCYHP